MGTNIKTEEELFQEAIRLNTEQPIIEDPYPSINLDKIRMAVKETLYFTQEDTLRWQKKLDEIG